MRLTSLGLSFNQIDKMSAQQKYYVDLLMKGLGVVGLGIIAFFASRFVANTEDTRDKVIMLNTKIEGIESDVDELKNDVKQIRLKP